MQINATRYHHTPIKIAKIKKKVDKTKCWQRYGETGNTGSLVHGWWDIKMVCHSGKHFGSFYKN